VKITLVWLDPTGRHQESGRLPSFREADIEARRLRRGGCSFVRTIVAKPEPGHENKRGGRR